MDFEVADLSAIPTPPYQAKIERVEKILSGLSRKPHLLSFSECCASDFLIQRAATWAANWDVVTICGTRFNPATSRIEAVIIHRSGLVTAEKQRLSPYDQPNCSATIHAGSTPGRTFSLPVIGADGEYHDVGIGVLVCYDFRYQYQNPAFARWGSVQMIVVPMWDRKFTEPQDKAGELARRYWTRCLLVSKAEPRDNLVGRHFPRLAKLLRRSPSTEWLAGGRLPSTGHGQFNVSDLTMLHKFGPNKKNCQLWKQVSEGFLIGDYEVGVPVTPGHDNAYGTGFNYIDFQRFAFE